MNVPAGEQLAVVGIDADGVLQCFIDSVVIALARIGLHPVVPRAQLGDTYALHPAFGMDAVSFEAALSYATDTGLLYQGFTFPGAVEALDRLHRAGHRIHVVTARPDGSVPGMAERLTRRWLARDCIPHTSVTVSRDKTVVATDVFLDDLPVNYDALDRAGCVPYLLDQPWNRDGTCGRRRVASVAEFVDLVAGRTRDQVRALALPEAA